MGYTIPVMTTAPYSLQLATPGDAQAIAQLSRDEVEQGLEWRWRTPKVHALIRDPEASVLCAKCRSQGGTLLGGFGIMRFGDEVAHLNLLAVRPSIRRQGMGMLMLKWLEQSAVTCGLARVDLEVRLNNHGARTFYRRAGYRPGQMIQGYYQGREAALRMHKNLRECSDFPPADINHWGS